MDEKASGSAHDLPPASETAAGNIRRYRDDHRSGSARAISVVLQVVAGAAGRERAGSTSGRSADPADPADPDVRLAIDRLRRHRGSNAP